ncbi:mitochondrial chaperone BCS1 [Fusarium austroafricanum]|uniref:Mitochondrial chaperone BCS1 n=1 Tax=Fusarium austroafricanum TaxID=2364996 RepID=A0A8H4K4I8_9HYPO|nr:mitochondrial chaperone BCS1 [Fusarium austroafricanum]
METLNSSGPGEAGLLPNISPPPSQFAILDFLFPGFSTFSSIIHAYLGIDLNLYIPLLLVVSGIMFAWNYITEYSWSIIGQHLMSSVRIRTDDEIYNIVMAWVANQRFAQGSRRFMVNTNINSRSWFLFRWDDDNDEEESGSTKKTLQYTPSVGSHFFWYKGHVLLFERHENRERSSFLTSSEREELSISCFGRNPRIIKELLIDAREQYLKKDEKKTIIYRGSMGTNGGDPTWQRCMSRASRPISTVILNEKVKKDLIADVEDYLNPNTRRWYSNRGIPYRRGYLLYGPPGTGKSSLSLALAGFFRMRIYMVSLSSAMASEENLATLFAELPRKCVVLLEDIDTAGLTHTREETKGDGAQEPIVPAVSTPSKPGVPPTTTPAIPGRLSLSGLLNILDGVASQEGRVLIMTTNHLEKLDKALIRPGRVDMIVEFGRADADMSASIFRAIYAPYEGEDAPAKDVEFLGPDEAQKQAALAEKTRHETMERVNALAAKFAAKVPELEFSPAEIQGLLLKHKRNPEAVLDAVDDWVVETRKEKKAKEIEDAEKRRKEEQEARKAEAKKKRKEERAKAKKKKAKAKRKSNGESSGSDSSDSDTDSENEGRTDEKKEEDKQDKKDTEKLDDKSEDKPKEAREQKKLEVPDEEAGESKSKGTSDSGYDTPNPVS